MVQPRTDPTNERLPHGGIAVPKDAKVGAIMGSIDGGSMGRLLLKPRENDGENG
jgi:hypothetical protein